MIVGGEGAVANLLKIIPQLPQDINGALLVILRTNKTNIDSLTAYLNSISTINIIRVSEGVLLQGGNCYFAGEAEVPVFRPYSAQYSFHLAEDGANSLPLNRSIQSFSQTFKSKLALTLISGADRTAVEQTQTLKKNGGRLLLLSPDRCLESPYKAWVGENDANCWLHDEGALALQIAQLHSKFRDSIVTA